MSTWLPLGIMVGVFLTLNVVGLIVNRRIGPGLSPRTVRKRNRWVVFQQGISLAMIACLLFLHRVVGWQMSLLLIVIVVSMAPMMWLVMRRQTEGEAQKNFAHDTGHCGRCEYDLTGNVSGICPECGWEIPKTPMRLEDPKWAFWWRKWEIEYLEDWPRNLRMARLNVVMFVAVAIALLVWFWIYGSEPWWFALLLTLPSWLIAGHMLILGVRVVAYGRRQGNKRGGETQGPGSETGEP